MNRDGVRRCKRCILDSTIPNLRFNQKGVCSHCELHDRLEERYPLNEKGERRLQKIIGRIRRDGKGKTYDCIVGISGGRDTTFCLYKCVELKLRPLAVHFDNGWDSDIAKRNLAKVCRTLGVDLHTVIADWEESRALTNCTIHASLPYIDITDDIGIARALYDSAVKEHVNWIIHSHSFRAEGINPLKWNYMDGRLVTHLIKRFGHMKFSKFKNVTLHNLFYWAVVRRIKVLTLTNYYDDRGPKVDEFLKQKFDWEDTGGWHYDNEIFGLVCYYSRHKFGFDWRTIELAARVRTSVMTRDEALDELTNVPPIEGKEIVEYALKKQRISREEFVQIMNAEPKYFTDYPTYYPTIKALRLPIKILSRLNVLPGSTYEKFFET